jgi:hypothetical protein
LPPSREPGADYLAVVAGISSDPETIIVEQEVLGTSASAGEFALPNIVVLTARNGQIVRLRDSASIPAAAAAMGRDI